MRLNNLKQTEVAFQREKLGFRKKKVFLGGQRLLSDRSPAPNNNKMGFGKIYIKLQNGYRLDSAKEHLLLCATPLLCASTGTQTEQPARERRTSSGLLVLHSSKRLRSGLPCGGREPTPPAPAITRQCKGELRPPGLPGQTRRSAAPGEKRDSPQTAAGTAGAPLRSSVSATARVREHPQKPFAELGTRRETWTGLFLARRLHPI